MALTGDLAHIHIFDIIQLIHTTRKSGTFSVRGSKGESRIIFSNGYIVGANHLNNKIRIGTVLVKMNAITSKDLERALEVQKESGKNRKPLIVTLIEMGKLGHDEAFRGLKKLIEITIAEIIGWTEGKFTFDTEAIAVSNKCSYLPDKMEQEVNLDAQMVLMDALRIVDERARDLKAGKQVPSHEELFQEVIPSNSDLRSREGDSVLTADDLGLADLDQLDMKIPMSFSDKEIFDPVEIHRQKIKETLSDFSEEEQEAFVSFLEKFTTHARDRTGVSRMEGQNRAIILFSRDKLIKHSVMTICKNESILVFATESEEELGGIIDNCLSKNVSLIVVFDSPETSDNGLSEENIVSIRQQVKKRYSMVSNIQLASPFNYTFTLQSFNEGIKAIIPKPLRETGKETFIKDTIKFLETFKTYIVNFLHEEKNLSTIDRQLSDLRDRTSAIRNLSEPPDVTFALLQFVSEVFERSITFLVRSSELVGKEAIGINAEKTMGPISLSKLKIPLTKPSIFSDVIENGRIFYGESDDAVLKNYLFKEIGAPLSSNIILIPIKSLLKTVTLTYGDFGIKEASPVPICALEILANQVGVVLENTLYRKHLNKASQK